MGLGSRVAGLFQGHFLKTLGLGFENDVIPAVNSYEWEFAFQSEPLMKVKLFLRSGDSVLSQFSFLETHLPMAGNAVHACCSFCWSEESSVATSENESM